MLYTKYGFIVVLTEVTYLIALTMAKKPSINLMSSKKRIFPKYSKLTAKNFDAEAQTGFLYWEKPKKNMKSLIIFLVALGIPQPYQERPPEKPTSRINSEAVFFKDETEEYFQSLRRFGPSAKKIKRFRPWH